MEKLGQFKSRPPGVICGYVVSRELLDQELFTDTDQPMPEPVCFLAMPLPDVVHTKRRLLPWFPRQLWKTALAFVFCTRMFLLRNRNDAGSLTGLKRKTAQNDETNPRA